MEIPKVSYQPERASMKFLGAYQVLKLNSEKANKRHKTGVKCIWGKINSIIMTTIIMIIRGKGPIKIGKFKGELPARWISQELTKEVLKLNTEKSNKRHKTGVKCIWRKSN